MIRKNDIRKISVTGASKSYFVTLPKDIIRALNWKKGEKKVVSLRGKTIVIKDWKG